MKAKSALSLALVAGVAATASAERTPQYKSADHMLDHGLEIAKTVNIYYNVATGEKIVSLDRSSDAVRGAADGASGPVWVTADEVIPCADFGGTSSGPLVGLDFPSTTNYTSVAFNTLWGGFADIEFDTVIDCVRFTWASTFPDTDTDSDSVGDGIVGFSGVVGYWDGFFPAVPNLNSTAVPAFAVQVGVLPGNDPSVPAGFVSVFELDIDLANDLVGGSSVFELGDTDSDLNGADVHNAGFGKSIMDGGPDADSDSLPDGDANGNGLADVGQTLFFSQPGTIDTDNADSDSDSTTGIDGVGTPMAITATLFGVPDPGMPVFDSSNSDWDWEPAGPGAVDHADIIIAFPNDPLNFDIPLFSFGGGFGFSCGDPMNMDPSDDAPHASMDQLNLGPAGVTPGCSGFDLDASGAIDFGDVSEFLTLFAAGDLTVDFDNSGSIDFGDVSEFLTGFAAGCP